MTLWKNTRTGTVYSERLNDFPSDPFLSMRKASTGKLSRVRRDHLVEYAPDAGLAFEEELPMPATIGDPWAGEPAADPGEPDHVESAVEVADVALRDVQASEHPAYDPAPRQLSLPRLPQVHGDLRGLSYNVGSAIALLLENPGSEDALRVAILMLGDEVDRLRA